MTGLTRRSWIFLGTACAVAVLAAVPLVIDAFDLGCASDVASGPGVYSCDMSLSTLGTVVCLMGFVCAAVLAWQGVRRRPDRSSQ